MGHHFGVEAVHERLAAGCCAGMIQVDCPSVEHWVRRSAHVRDVVVVVVEAGRDGHGAGVRFVDFGTFVWAESSAYTGPTTDEGVM